MCTSRAFTQTKWKSGQPQIQPKNGEKSGQFNNFPAQAARKLIKSGRNRVRFLQISYTKKYCTLLGLASYSWVQCTECLFMLWAAAGVAALNSYYQTLKWICNKTQEAFIEREPSNILLWPHHSQVLSQLARGCKNGGCSWRASQLLQGHLWELGTEKYWILSLVGDKVQIKLCLQCHQTC